MWFCKFVFLLVCLFLSTNVSFAQVSGSVKGRLIERDQHYALASATVTIRSANKQIVNYGLTDIYGRFSLGKLPLKDSLYLTVNSLGFATKTFSFFLKDATSLDLGDLHIIHTGILLEEVTIVPPVIMKGDTLIYNADAFQLDKNAVVEDLFHQLPGLVVWGDGSITVHGQKVSSVKVNGKTFFGTNASIATQNLPKDLVDQIKVYRTNVNLSNPLDTISEINITLKQNFQLGVFGKLHYGQGLKKGYQRTGNLNFFNKRSQISLIYDENDLNHTPGSFSQILSQNTFKPSLGLSVLDAGRLQVEGINPRSLYGMSFDHDFHHDPQAYYKNQLNMNFRHQEQHTDIRRNDQFWLRLQDQQSILRSNERLSTSYVLEDRFQSGYYKSSYGSTFRMQVHGKQQRANNQFTDQTNTINDAGDLLSRSSKENRTQDQTKQMELDAIYRFHNQPSNGEILPKQLHYTFAVKDGLAQRYEGTDFKDVGDLSQAAYFEREAHLKEQELSNRLEAKIEDFSKLVFPFLPRSFSANLVHAIQHRLHLSDEAVQGKDELEAASQTLDDLSAFQRFNALLNRSTLQWKYTYNRSLSSRFQKNASLELDLHSEHFLQDNQSDNYNLRFKRSYYSLLPAFVFQYKHHVIAHFQSQVQLKVEQSITYPESTQLYRLVDEANLYGNVHGNPALGVQKNTHFSGDYAYTKHQSHREFSVRIAAHYQKMQNTITDSIQITSDGRSHLYKINRSGSDQWSGQAEYAKAFKWGEHLLELRVNGRLMSIKVPLSINSVEIINHTLSTQDTIGIGYRWLDKIRLDVKQGFTMLQSKQINSEQVFRNKVHTSMLVGGGRMYRRLTLESSLNHHIYQSHQQGSRHITLWNTSLAYRLLDKENLELKCTAIDVLNQNQIFLFQQTENSYQIGNVNGLRQRVLVSLAYYPRYFKNKNGR
jgi:hypothetical protein